MPSVSLLFAAYAFACCALSATLADAFGNVHPRFPVVPDDGRVALVFSDGTVVQARKLGFVGVDELEAFDELEFASRVTEYSILSAERYDIVTLVGCRMALAHDRDDVAYVERHGTPDMQGTLYGSKEASFKCAYGPDGEPVAAPPGAFVEAVREALTRANDADQ